MSGKELAITGRWVYVVLLENSAWESRKFRDQNPEYDPDSMMPLLYVGSTVHTPEERLKQHQDGYKSSSIVKKYARRLLPEYCVQLNSSNSRVAEEEEAGLAANLREQGFGVYQN